MYGLKPSHGRVSGYPTVSTAVSMAVLGPMAATMADLDVAYRVMAAPDPRVASSALFPPPKGPSADGDIQQQQRSTKKIPLGVFQAWFDRADPPVRSACQTALDALVATGNYVLVPITIPHIHAGQTAHALTILSEKVASVPNTRDLTAPNKVLLAVASRTPAADFLRAQKLREMLMRHLAHLFKENPGLVVVTPTTPNAGACIAGGDADLKYGVSDGNTSVRSMEYIWLANFAGLPALSVPVGYVDAVRGEGRVPVGLMGMGEWGTEEALIEWGYDCEEWLEGGLEGGRRKPGNWVDVLGLAREGV